MSTTNEELKEAPLLTPIHYQLQPANNWRWFHVFHRCPLLDEILNRRATHFTGNHGHHLWCFEDMGCGH